MYQIKAVLLHELAELPVYRQILRFERAAHKINLMADNPGSDRKSTRLNSSHLA